MATVIFYGIIEATETVNYLYHSRFGNGFGNGHGYGDGFGNGCVFGDGYGYGNGSGRGDGYSKNTKEVLMNFECQR